MVVTDITLSRRLERAEGHANAAFVESRAAIAPAMGACWIEVAGILAMFDGVGSPLTQTFGLGLDAEPAAGELERVESFFADRGADVFHEVSPLAPPGHLPLLADRGYRPVELTTVMWQELSRRTVRPHASLAVHRVAPATADEWAEVAAAGWGESPELASFMREFSEVSARARGTECFTAEWEGTPIATAALAIHDGVALLAGASTLPAWRGRGAQGALLDARLARAAEVGCDVAMMCAAPGSRSQRNAERQGFRIAYTRTKWHRPHGGGQG